jgi:uncharacterized membrane protein YkvA (DUF1232 family)
MASRLAPHVAGARAIGARASIGYVHAFFRFMFDRKAPFFGKLWIVFAVAYVIMPLDVVPDLAPIIGWLDDLGIVAITLGYLARVLKPYRFPQQSVITTTGTTVSEKTQAMAPARRGYAVPRGYDDAYAPSRPLATR